MRTQRWHRLGSAAKEDRFSDHDCFEGAPMSVQQAEFRQVMGHFATGVTIITTHDGGGQLFGLTANAVASVSLDPPLVLVCVDKAAESYASFAASGAFTVNLLSQAQEALSRRFAKSGGDKFTGVGFRIGKNGAAVLDDVIAHLECEIRHRFEAGDHTIFVGEAIALAVSSEEDPLLFFRGGYRNLSA
jgi:flavin reductase (DIM6/NTAB) family NADH-FMN oxidoreductase RutF